MVDATAHQQSPETSLKTSLKRLVLPVAVTKRSWVMPLFSAPIFITMYSSDLINDSNILPGLLEQGSKYLNPLGSEHATQAKDIRPHKRTIKSFRTKTRTLSSILTSCDLQQAQPSQSHATYQAAVVRALQALQQARNYHGPRGCQKMRKVGPLSFRLSSFVFRCLRAKLRRDLGLQL